MIRGVRRSRGWPRVRYSAFPPCEGSPTFRGTGLRSVRAVASSAIAVAFKPHPSCSTGVLRPGVLARARRCLLPFPCHTKPAPSQISHVSVVVRRFRPSPSGRGTGTTVRVVCGRGIWTTSRATAAARAASRWSPSRSRYDATASGRSSTAARVVACSRPTESRATTSNARCSPSRYGPWRTRRSRWMICGSEASDEDAPRAPRASGG
jgi:hypothetical protein